jgi:hypothetical protein
MADGRMGDQGNALNRTPTAAWLAEQEAKQAAYAARRRTWTHTLARRAMPEADRAEEATEPPATEVGTTNQVGHTGKQRRPRGPVHDPRQGRLAF